jgi:hypothetical protein
LISRPGVSICSSSAEVDGLCTPSPSATELPGWQANAISVPVPPATGAGPRPTACERVSMLRASVGASGLCRQVSRITMLSRFSAPPIRASTSSTGKLSTGT